MDNVKTCAAFIAVSTYAFCGRWHGRRSVTFMLLSRKSSAALRCDVPMCDVCSKISCVGRRRSSAFAFARISVTDIFSIKWLIVSEYGRDLIFEILPAIFLKKVMARWSHAPKQSTTNGRKSIP